MPGGWLIYLIFPNLLIAYSWLQEGKRSAHISLHVLKLVCVPGWKEEWKQACWVPKDPKDSRVALA